MKELLNELSKLILGKEETQDISDLEYQIALEKQVSLEIARRTDADKLLKILAPSLYDKDPIKRAKDLVNGKFDFIASGIKVYEDYKKSCKLLLSKLGLI
jgi:hypothetical protein|nr:MAG TPA: hypothetical protein [Caudoviricetes sp.]